MTEDAATHKEKGEYTLTDTVFIKDIESRVFQTIVIKCLAQIEGVSFLGGTLIDHLLGREGVDRIKGIYVEQDQNNHSVSVKIEVNVAYGISIPEKADEVQERVAKEITKLTGLHVSCVHVIFKGIIPEKPPEQKSITEVESNELDDWGLDEESLLAAAHTEEDE